MDRVHPAFCCRRRLSTVASVSGLAALVLSQNAALPAAKVQALILENVFYLPAVVR